MDSGIFLIDKPEGVSSAKAISYLKRSIPGIRKIGHAGTLDPFATGLLVAMVNSATRLASVAEAGEKIYSGEFRLGVNSDTHDRTGELQSCDGGRRPRFDELQDYISQNFIGEIAQLPPKVSALKVNGKRAYKLLRKGEDFELKHRNVHVSEFEIAEISSSPDLFHFRIRCSKGTYIRSFARDIGLHFGCGALVENLRREASWPFSSEQMRPLEQIQAADLLPWTELFPDAGHLVLESQQIRLLQNGVQSACSNVERQVQIEFGDSKRFVIGFSPGSDQAISLLRRGEQGWEFMMSMVSGNQQESEVCHR